MKKILLPLLAAGLCASAFAATTADDLNGKNVAVILQGNDFQLSFPVAATGSTFTKQSNGTLMLNNIYDGLARSFTVLSDGSLVLNLYDAGSNGAGPFNWGPGMSEVYGILSACYEGQFYYNFDGEQAICMFWADGFPDEQYPSTSHVLDINTQGIEGWGFNHRNSSNYALLAEWTDRTGNILYDVQCFNGMTIYAFDTNSTVTEYQGDFVADMYNVDVQINGDKLEIKNFLNQGMSYNVNPQTLEYGINWVEGEIDKENGLVYIPVQYIAGEVDFGFLGDGSYYDTYLGYLTMQFEGLGYVSGHYFYYDGTSYYPWQLIDYSTFTGDSAAPVTGTYYTEGGTSTGRNRWVTDGGDCKISVNSVIDLGPAGIYASSMGQVIASADRIKIETQNEQTLDVNVAISAGTYYQGNASVGGMIMTKANGELVDHYDIYALPGRYTSIYDGGFTIDDATGHANAILVYDGTQASTRDYMFMTTFSHDAEDNGNQDFTYFIKANYKPESGIQPTFHALTPASMANTAAEIEATELAQVTAANGVITIKGTDVEATVYNAAGAVVYQGFDREIPATAGVYVVRLGDTVKKVVL